MWLTHLSVASGEGDKVFLEHSFIADMWTVQNHFVFINSLLPLFPNVDQLSQMSMLCL